MMDAYTEPHWAQCALITIDMQRDTLDGQPLEVPGTSAVLPRLTALAEAFRKAGSPIFHLIRIYKADGSNVDACRRSRVEQGAPLFLAGSPGSQLADGLLPQAGTLLDSERLLGGGIQPIGPHESLIYKPRWGVFYQTPLEARLGELGVSTLVFSGCNFPNCPRTSIYEASERDFRIVLAEDAMSGLYTQGRKEMEGIGVAVLPTANIIAHCRA